MHNNTSSSKTENDKTDSWSFSFDYHHFSNKNKPKSLLGRRTLRHAVTQQNQDTGRDAVFSSCNKPTLPERTPLKSQHFNGHSLTHPLKPNITPTDKFSQPLLDSQLIFSKQKSQFEKNDNCQRRLGFSTPYKFTDCPPKEIGNSHDDVKLDNHKAIARLNGENKVTKDVSSMFFNSNMLNKDLNTSFICEDTYPLSIDNSLSNDTDNRIKPIAGDKSIDISLTENGNNSCFMTAHEIHPPNLSSNTCNDFNFKTPRRKHDSFSLKTPGRNFTLFSISQSPIDPLAGILNEDNESFISDCDPNCSSEDKSEELNNKLCAQDQSQVDIQPPTSTIKPLESDKKSESLGNRSKTLSETERNDQSLSSKKLENQCIPDISPRNYGSNSLDRKIDSEIPAVTSHNEELTKKTSKHLLNVEPYQKSTTGTPSSPFKNLPTVIVKNKESIPKPLTCPACPPVSNIQPHQVPVDIFMNARLIKPQPQNILYVNNKPYAALSLLGRGGSSEVFQVLEENSSRLLAIKCVNLASVEESTAKGYLNEIELLSKLQGCPSVIKMLDHEYDECTKMLYVVMEKGDIDLAKLIKDTTKIKEVPMSMIIYYWSEMLSAVKDIHDKGVIHSDLKPSNFLLVCGRLKLIDFGIASSIQGDMTSVEKDVVRGTFNYISPEAISACENRFHKISYKSDVWSLGCILYNLLFGHTPFSHITSTLGKFQAIADPNYKIKFPKDCKHIPPALKLSLRWCLIKDPKSRPTVDSLLILSNHAIRVPQIDNLWYQYVIKELPDCCVSLDDLKDTS